MGDLDGGTYTVVISPPPCGLFNLLGCICLDSITCDTFMFIIIGTSLADLVE